MNIFKKKTEMSVAEARILTMKGKANIIQSEYEDIVNSIKNNASYGFDCVIIIGEPCQENKIKLESLGYKVTSQKMGMMNKNDTMISWGE